MMGNKSGKRNIIITVIAAAAVFTAILGSFGEGKVVFGGLGERVSGRISLKNKEIGSLILDLDSADLEITYGDKPEIYYEAYSIESEPEVFFEKGKLFVKESGKESIHIGVFNNNDKKIKLLLPEDTELQKINIDMNVGDIKLKGLSCGNLTIKNDVGNILAEDFSVSERLKANIDVGNIKLKDMNLEDGIFFIDSGNLLAEGEFDSISANIKAGDIEIFSEKEIDVNSLYLNTEAGNINVNKQKWNGRISAYFYVQI